MPNLLDRLRNLLPWRRTPEDVPPDPHTARTRETGGRATAGGDADQGDHPTTTGVGRSDEFVGRVAGQDPGFDEETGAEVRAEQEHGRRRRS